MNNPVSAILDGLSMAGIHWPPILGILLLLLTGQALLALLLYGIFKDTFSGEEYVSLSLAGWLLPASLISLLWYLGAQIVPPPFITLALGILLLAGLVLSLRMLKGRVGTSKGVVWSLFLLAGLSILLRLAFISKAVFPSYFDSAQHYLYIREILAHAGSPGSGTALLPGYYHLGFHFLAAFLTNATHAGIADTMLVLGQVILALMPFSAFFIVRHWTGSNIAAFFALTLAAFGWYMPAHAVDWGKYPALASLALVPFVLSIAYLSIENRDVLPKEKYAGLIFLLLAGMLISVLLHSRSLVLYMLLAAAWLVTSAWKRMSKRPRLLLFGLFLLALAGEIIYIQSRGILGPLFDAYGSKGMLISLTVLLLSVFACKEYPGLVFFCIVSITLLLASMFVPLGSLVPGYANTTLLDRPYVQMLLYLPLTLLAGFGLAGLEQVLKGEAITPGKYQLAVGKIIGGLFILLVIIRALFQYDLYPSDCCVIVSQDDLAAIQWLDENLPADAHILTASTNLNVLPTGRYQGSAGGDAGTWIMPLTGRPVALLPFNTDFSQQQTIGSLCQQKVNYVYVGKTGWYFNDAGVSSQPESYKLILDLPKARIYEITGCN
jgi:hypothetical protein